jgi:hypothetical protein
MLLCTLYSIPIIHVFNRNSKLSPPEGSSLVIEFVFSVVTIFLSACFVLILAIISVQSHSHVLNHQVSLDIDRLREAPVKGQREIPYAFSTTCAIYKVQERLRELNEKAYTPRVVSIGPIHHGKEKLKAMEVHKRMYLREFLARTGVSEEAFIELIK